MGTFYYFRKMVDEKYLSEQVIIKTNILNYEVISKIKKRFFDGEPYLYNRTWTLVVLTKSLKENVG